MSDDDYPAHDAYLDSWEPDEDWLANESLDAFTDHVGRTIRDLRSHPRAGEVTDLIDRAELYLSDSCAIFVDGVGSAHAQARNFLELAEDTLLKAQRRIDRRQPPSPWHPEFVGLTDLSPPCTCGGQLGWFETVDGIAGLYCGACGEPVDPNRGGAAAECDRPAPVIVLGPQQAMFEVPADPSVPSKASRRPIPPKLRAEVFLRANMRCEWCNVAADTAKLQIGHILSVRDGHALGVPPDLLNSFDNLMLQCEECNQGLGGESMPTWIVARILQARAMKGRRRRPPPD